VSDATQSIVQRVVAEHRRLVYTLAAGVVLNILAFAFLVYPLQSDVANVEQRTRAAEAELAAAQADFGRANGAGSPNWRSGMTVLMARGIFWAKTTLYVLGWPSAPRDPLVPGPHHAVIAGLARHGH
jgi:hypothetical protein